MVTSFKLELCGLEETTAEHIASLVGCAVRSTSELVNTCTASVSLGNGREGLELNPTVSALVPPQPLQEHVQGTNAATEATPMRQLDYVVNAVHPGCIRPQCRSS